VELSARLEQGLEAPRALASRREEAGVVDRDRGRHGEHREELLLRLGEAPRARGLTHAEQADHLVVEDQRDLHRRVLVPLLHRPPLAGVEPFVVEVLDGHSAFVHHPEASRTLRARDDGADVVEIRRRHLRTPDAGVGERFGLGVVQADIA
jgi:hypothetical protein